MRDHRKLIEDLRSLREYGNGSRRSLISGFWTENRAADEWDSSGSFEYLISVELSRIDPPGEVTRQAHPDHCARLFFHWTVVVIKADMSIEAHSLVCHLAQR